MDDLRIFQLEVKIVGFTFSIFFIEMRKKRNFWKIIFEFDEKINDKSIRGCAVAEWSKALLDRG